MIISIQFMCLMSPIIFPAVKEVLWKTGSKPGASM
jgi:hypothetical protein